MSTLECDYDLYHGIVSCRLACQRALCLQTEQSVLLEVLAICQLLEGQGSKVMDMSDQKWSLRKVRIYNLYCAAMMKTNQPHITMMKYNLLQTTMMKNNHPHTMTVIITMMYNKVDCLNCL